MTRKILHEYIDRFASELPLLPFRAATIASTAAAMHETPLSGAALDIGCGDGFFMAGCSEVRARHGVSNARFLVGIDASAKKLRYARERGVYAAVVRADAAALPFREGAFDAVVSNDVLPFVGDLDATLDEIARVVVDGGRVIAAVNEDRFWIRLGVPQALKSLGFSNAAERVGRRHAAAYGIRHALDAEGWRQRFDRAGLHARVQTVIPGALAFGSDLARATLELRILGRTLLAWGASFRHRCDRPGLRVINKLSERIAVWTLSGLARIGPAPKVHQLLVADRS